MIWAGHHAAKLKLSCHEVRRLEKIFCISAIMEICTELSIQQTTWKEKINEWLYTSILFGDKRNSTSFANKKHWKCEVLKASHDQFCGANSLGIYWFLSLMIQYSKQVLLWCVQKYFHIPTFYENTKVYAFILFNIWHYAFNVAKRAVQFYFSLLQTAASRVSPPPSHGLHTTVNFSKIVWFLSI